MRARLHAWGRSVEPICNACSVPFFAAGDALAGLLRCENELWSAICFQLDRLVVDVLRAFVARAHLLHFNSNKELQLLFTQRNNTQRLELPSSDLITEDVEKGTITSFSQRLPSNYTGSGMIIIPSSIKEIKKRVLVLSANYKAGHDNVLDELTALLDVLLKKKKIKYTEYLQYL